MRIAVQNNYNEQINENQGHLLLTAIGMSYTNIICYVDIE